MFLPLFCSRPHGFLAVCRCLENEAAQPDCKANVVARGECREEGGGDDVGREDGERDECDPSCLCKEGDCEALGLLESVASELTWGWRWLPWF